mmetsp:Transcript_17687/g.29897  ORF Transcript_17687/g.29897 Transcript_17687/m.29897 type:complete len:442 (+) Transcript_17687:459-1784(+)
MGMKASPPDKNKTLKLKKLGNLEVCISQEGGTTKQEQAHESSDSISSSSSTKKSKFELNSLKLEVSEQKKVIGEKAEDLKKRLVEEEFYKHYNEKTIHFIFILVFLSNVFINVDHGSLPGCSNDIKKDLNIGNLEFGTLGSVVYGGLTLGSAVATWVYQHDRWIKLTLAFTLALNSISIYLFTVTNSFAFDTYLRFMIGFFQVFACIYQPVWADTFARESQKAAWLTFLILASPLGVVIGFSLTSVMTVYKTWRWSFYIQGLFLVPCVFFFTVLPNKYFEIQSTVRFKKQCAHNIEKKLFKAINFDHIKTKENNPMASSESNYKNGLNPEFQELLDNLTNQVMDDPRLQNDKSTVLKVRQTALKRITKELKRQEKELNPAKEGGEPPIQLSSKPEERFITPSFRGQLASLFKNLAFVCLCLSLTGLYFVVTGIQYWTPDYL